MKNIIVNLKAEYGANCMGSAYSSDEIQPFEVSEKVAEIISSELEKHGGELKKADVEELVKNGCTDLEKKKKKINKALNDMIIRYWVEEADSVDSGILYESMLTSMEEGSFKPSLTVEEFCQENDIDMEEEEFDPEDIDEYQEFLLDEYDEWLSGQDIHEQAFLIGLDVDAALEETEADYTITAVSED